MRTGPGLRTRGRTSERAFYDGTAIDALRLFRRSVLAATGGAGVAAKGVAAAAQGVAALTRGEDVVEG